MVLSWCLYNNISFPVLFLMGNLLVPVSILGVSQLRRRKVGECRTEAIASKESEVMSATVDADKFSTYILGLPSMYQADSLLSM